MKIGIIGSGTMGGGLGRLWAKHGHHVMFSYSRSGGIAEDHVSANLLDLLHQFGAAQFAAA